MANIDKFRVDGTTYDFIDSTARTTANAAVPQTRTVNSKALSSDITLTSEDIGYDSSATYTDGTIGAGVSELKTATDNITDIIADHYENFIKKADINASYPTIGTGLSKSNISNGAFDVEGTATGSYPNIIFNYPVEIGHKYLFAVTMKEISNNGQSWNLIVRYGGTSTVVTRTGVSGYPYNTIPSASAVTNFVRGAVVVEPTLEQYNTLDFTVSGVLDSSKQASISVKDVILTDVTGVSDDRIVEIVAHGYFDYLFFPKFAEKADLINNYWHNKKILVIGDSTSVSGVWQQKLASVLGATVSTHALDGIGLVQMVAGGEGSLGTLDPLYMSDVYDKDLIILFGGINSRNALVGQVGDLYELDGTGQSTIAGYLQFDLNWIYEKLAGGTDDSGTFAENLSCKILVIPPYCCGKYSWNNVDGYGEFPEGSGQTLQTLGQMMIDVAHANNCEAWNAWENSGIGRHTWAIWASSPTPTRTPDGTETAPYPGNADQVHLNTDGYNHFAECVSAVLTTIR